MHPIRVPGSLASSTTNTTDKCVTKGKVIHIEYKFSSALISTSLNFKHTGINHKQRYHHMCIHFLKLSLTIEK